MPKPNKRPEDPQVTTPGPTATPTTDRTILVDSRVVAASPKGQRDIKQKRSPTITFLPIPGVQVWSVDPGLNVHITSDTWDAYKTQHSQIAGMMNSGQIRRLDSLPTDPDLIENLVERSINVAALEFILSELKDGAVGDRQASLIKLTEERLRRANPVTIETTKWRPRAERPATSQFVM